MEILKYLNDSFDAAISGFAGNRRNTQRCNLRSNELSYIKTFKPEQTFKTVYVGCGEVLVKISIEAEKSYKYGFVEFIRYKCRVLEIDGRSQQERNGASYERPYSVPLTPEEQLKLILDALELYGITGYPVRVSDEYVQGKLRVIELQQKIRKGGA